MSLLYTPSVDNSCVKANHYLLVEFHKGRAPKPLAPDTVSHKCLVRACHKPTPRRV